MIEIKVDANEASKSLDGIYDPVPEGEYTVVCVKLEDQSTKDNSGKYLKAQFEIVEGDYAKKKLFCNYNYQNKSVPAVKMAMRQLQAWVLQSGLAKDGEQFAFNPPEMVGTTIKVKVTVKKKPAFADPATGKVFPEKLENDMQILPPGKSGDVKQSEKTVDKSAQW